MAIATLTIDINAKLANIEKDLGKVAHLAEQSGQRMAGAFASAKTALVGLTGVLGLGVFVEFYKSAIDTADALKDLSKSTSISIEQLAGLSMASKQSGGDLESIATSINKLSVNMGKDPDKFKKLGITAKEPLEAFKQLADVFVAIEDPQKRAAVAAAALGKAWAGSAPLLAEGGKRIGEMVANGTNLSGVTPKMAEEAKKFNDTLTALKTSFGGFFISSVGPALPIMIRLAEYLAESGKAAKTAGSGFSLLRTTFETVAVLGANVAFVFGGVGREIGAMGAQINALAHGDLKGYKAISEAVKADGERARAELDKFEQSILNPKQAPAEKPQERKAGPSDKSIKDFIDAGAAAAKAASERAAAAKKALEADQAYMKGVAELGDKIFALNDVEKSNTEKLQEKLDLMPRVPPVMRETMQAALDLAKAIEQESDAHKINNDTIDREIEAQGELYDAEKKIKDDMDSAAGGWADKLRTENENLNADLIVNDKERAKEQLRIEHERILETIEAELAGNEKLTEAVAAENVNYDLRIRKLDETKSMAHDLGLTFTSAFEDAVTGGKKFGDVLKSLAIDIEKLVLRRTITEPLMASLSGILDNFSLSGGKSSTPGQLYFNGDPVDEIPIKSFAVGTNYVPHDMVARIHKGEKIVPAAQNNDSAGASINYAPVINIDSRTDRNEVFALVNRAIQNGNDMLVDRLQREGAIA